MAQKKFVVGCFDDEKVLFPAVKQVRTAGYKIQDVYTPFPVHGLDHALGMRETSLHTAGLFMASQVPLLQLVVLAGYSQRTGL